MSDIYNQPWSMVKTVGEERSEKESSCAKTVEELVAEKDFDAVITFLGYIEEIGEVGKDFITKMLNIVLKHV